MIRFIIAGVALSAVSMGSAFGLHYAHSRFGADVVLQSPQPVLNLTVIEEEAPHGIAATAPALGQTPRLSARAISAPKAETAVAVPDPAIGLPAADNALTLAAPPQGRISPDQPTETAGTLDDFSAQPPATLRDRKVTISTRNAELGGAEVITNEQVWSVGVYR